MARLTNKILDDDRSTRSPTERTKSSQRSRKLLYRRAYADGKTRQDYDKDAEVGFVVGLLNGEVTHYRLSMTTANYVSFNDEKGLRQRLVNAIPHHDACHNSPLVHGMKQVYVDSMHEFFR